MLTPGDVATAESRRISAGVSMAPNTFRFGGVIWCKRRWHGQPKLSVPLVTSLFSWARSVSRAPALFEEPAEAQVYGEALALTAIEAVGGVVAGDGFPAAFADADAFALDVVMAGPDQDLFGLVLGVARDE